MKRKLMWSPKKKNLCLLCQKIELPPDRSVCPTCNAKQLANIGEVAPETKSQMEIKDAAQPFRATSGYCNISSMVSLTKLSTRQVWQDSLELGLEPHHQKHRRVWPEEEINMIREYETRKTEETSIVYVDGQLFVNTRKAAEIAPYTPIWINELARYNTWPTFLMSGRRWHQLEGLEQYLVR
jgi:hypothetical protein